MGNLANCSPSPFGEGRGEAAFYLPLPSERDGERLYRVCYRLLRGYVQAVLKYPYKLRIIIVRKSTHYH